MPEPSPLALRICTTEGDAFASTSAKPSVAGAAPNAGETDRSTCVGSSTATAMRTSAAQVSAATPTSRRRVKVVMGDLLIGSRGMASDRHGEPEVDVGRAGPHVVDQAGGPLAAPAAAADQPV